MSCSDIPEYDIELYQGDDKTLKFRYKAEDIPVDLTGYVIELECTEAALGKTAVIAPDQVANTGEYEFVYIPSDTQNLTSFRVKYEVVFYPTGLAGEKTTKMRGSIKITKEVVA